MNTPLDRDTLLQALAALNAAVQRRGVRADVYVFEGAAMVLAYGADRPTRDIDAKFSPRGPVVDAAHEVADRLELPRSWLNDQASVYLSHQVDHGGPPVFDASHLRVQAASARHLLAMKILAAREHDPDETIPDRNRMALVDLFTP